MIHLEWHLKLLLMAQPLRHHSPTLNLTSIYCSSCDCCIRLQLILAIRGVAMGGLGWTEHVHRTLSRECSWDWYRSAEFR